MTAAPDETCQPAARSWVAQANAPATDFPLQNLPLAIVRPQGTTNAWRVGVAIGESVLDVAGCVDDGLAEGLPASLVAALRAPTLNPLMALGRRPATSLRQMLHRWLRDDVPPHLRTSLGKRLLPQERCEYALPAAVGGFTDFFASLHHASTVARLRKADAPLPPAYPFCPLAYHGRTSSLQVSDREVLRPWGPQKGLQGPRYAPTARLDYEAELGLFIGRGAEPGVPVPVREGHDHLFGACLLNDWSARDVQAFEAQPLGPFLSKNFATTLAPWVVTAEALEPFRVAAARHDESGGAPLPYLVDASDQARGAWSVVVSVELSSRAMREMDLAPMLMSTADLATLFWTPAQLIAHHTANGCALEPGDLLATGTISGPGGRSQAGSLLEITRGGREPLTLPTGESRQFLEDGDEVTLTARASAPGCVSIGFGTCRARISAARPSPP
jgi:fumarylacetoacetase